MTGASLALFVVLGQVPAADPSELISKLGAPRYADREAAAAALEKLGRGALEALKSARQQRDPEIRSRAAALMGRIEGSLLTQPTLVTLHAQETPLSDVVQSFSEQCGIKITLLPENSPTLRSRKVTLQEPGPLPFWKALDRLCDAAHLQYNMGMRYPNGREPSFPLMEGGARPTAPVSDSGPFRVTVTNIHHQRDVSFPLAPQPPLRNAGGEVPPKVEARPNVSEQFYAQLQVACEPRLNLMQSGQLRVTEAVDNKGNVLAVPQPAAGEVRHTGYLGYSSGPLLQVQAPMTRPASPGTKVKLLKGVVSVVVSSRKPNPLSVPLANSAGRTFQNDDVVLTVHDVRLRVENGPPSIELSVRANPEAGSPEAGPVRPETTQQQLEVVDAQGHGIPWYQSSIDAEAGRLTISLTSPEQAAHAAEVRFHSLIRANAEVAFEFNDLPLP